MLLWKIVLASHHKCLSYYISMAIFRRNFICYFVFFGSMLEISLQKVSFCVNFIWCKICHLLQHSDFYLSNYQLYTNDKHINESSLKEKCDVNTRQQPCKFTPHVKFHLIKEMKNPWLTVKGVHVNSNDSFVEQTFNLCTFDKIPVFDIFIALFYELFKKNINFEMKCPFKQVSHLYPLIQLTILLSTGRVYS